MVHGNHQLVDILSLGVVQNRCRASQFSSKPGLRIGNRQQRHVGRGSKVQERRINADQSCRFIHQAQQVVDAMQPHFCKVYDLEFISVMANDPF